MYGKLHAMCAPARMPHPLGMFVLRQFFVEVSKRIATLDWLGAGAASADRFSILRVRSSVTEFIVRDGLSR